ncbi:CAP domain-containing protein [Sphingomonas mesophila]|uniref:CAP domain-containing protein n=1 Tax=Sphingomonas mesophila TaxID=2303576 RepID=UPI0013C32CEF|nr:CAP domain-containing protein [Sphingomonas mesophila]
MSVRRLLVLLCVAAAAMPLPAASIGDSAFAERILALHNRERAAVGAPPLQWDPLLAESAASYGPTLMSLGRLVHSPRATRPGQRENLAMASTGYLSDQQLAGMWVAEKHHFAPGLFPHVSRTGNWEDVAHYTQMVWKGTTHVGCALYRGGGNDYLICRYSPPGNADGKPVY